MRNLKKWMTVALTAAMVVTQAAPVFASSASITGDGTTSGTANILAYSVDSIVVPTTLKVALNPNGYSLVKGYKTVGNGTAADTARKAGTAVFSKSFDVTSNDWIYKQVLAEGTAVVGKTEIMDSDTLKASTDTFYQYDFVNDQVISLNYGIANKSTKDKVVQIDIHVTQDTNDTAGKLPIDFVDSADKATYGSGTDNAGQDEMKMYLAVISAKDAAPTTDTFERVKEWAAGIADVPLYTKAADGKYALITASTGDGSVTVGDGTTKPAGSVADEANFKKALGTGDNATKLYKISTTIGPEITGKQLSDVTMTKAEAANAIAFAAGTENKANASIGFKLAEANYGVEAGENINAFDTTQEELKTKLQLSGLTGVAGFTLLGTMNKKVDWTRADTVALRIQPTYKVSDTTGNEEYISGSYTVDASTGAVTNTTVPFNQVKIQTKYISVTTISAAQNSVTVTLPDGVTVSSLTLTKAAGGDVALVSGTHYEVSGNIYTLDDNMLGNHVGGSITFAFSDSKEITLTIE